MTVHIVNDCPFFVGMVVLRSRSFVMTSPVVSKPTGAEVTFNSRSCTCEDPSLVRMAGPTWL